MHITYKAIKQSGESYTATVEATDEYELARDLRKKGETLISVESESEGGLQAWLNNLNTKLARVKLRDKIMFARNLSAMIMGGLTLSRSLGVLERQTKNLRFKQVIREMDALVQKGSSLSDAAKTFPDIFPTVFVAMVRAGEESGKLSDALNGVALQLGKAYELRRRVKGAMMYPMIIVIAMIIVGILLMMFVVPTLTSTFSELNVELPKSTKFIIALSSFMKNQTILFLGSLAAVVLLVAAWLKKPSGKRAVQFVLLRLPVIKTIVRETNAATTARTLSSLLFSGVEIVSAMSITKAVVQNVYFKEVLTKAEESIPKGGSIASAFLEREDLYPPLLAEMISVGEEAGSLPDMLLRVAEFYEGEVEEKTKNLSTVIEPMLMILIGAVVGFFAVSMISPIYSLSSGI